jgi:hypothetical protein
MAVYVPSPQDRTLEALMSMVNNYNQTKAARMLSKEQASLERDRLKAQQNTAMAGIGAQQSAALLAYLGQMDANKTGLEGQRVVSRNERDARLGVADRELAGERARAEGDVKVAEIDARVEGARIEADERIKKADRDAEWLAGEAARRLEGIQLEAARQQLDLNEAEAKARKDEIAEYERIQTEATEIDQLSHDEDYRLAWDTVANAIDNMEHWFSDDNVLGHLASFLRDQKEFSDLSTLDDNKLDDFISHATVIRRNINAGRVWKSKVTNDDLDKFFHLIKAEKNRRNLGKRLTDLDTRRSIAGGERGQIQEMVEYIKDLEAQLKEYEKN